MHQTASSGRQLLAVSGYLLAKESNLETGSVFRQWLSLPKPITKKTTARGTKESNLGISVSISLRFLAKETQHLSTEAHHQQPSITLSHLNYNDTKSVCQQGQENIFSKII
jgi:hypothetical protein